MISSRQLLATCILLLPMLHCVTCCSPKAVKSVFVGRAAAETAHQAKKAKYLAGETKTIAEKFKLSKASAGSGIIMEKIDPKKLKDEIKYLESIEKTLKTTKKRELKNAAKAAQREIAGKAPKVGKGPKQVLVVVPPPQPLPLYTSTAAVSPLASNAGSAAKNMGKRSGILGKKSAKHFEPPPAPPPVLPPVASVSAASSVVGDVGKGAKGAGKKTGFFGKASKSKPPEPPPRPPAPPPPPPPPPVLAEEVMKKKKRGIFGRR